MRRRAFVIPLLCAFFALFSCSSEPRVLDRPAHVLRADFKKGDIHAVLEAKPERLAEIARLGSAVPFYVGLLTEKYASHESARDDARDGANDAALRVKILFQAAYDTAHAAASDDAAPLAKAAREKLFPPPPPPVITAEELSRAAWTAEELRADSALSGRVGRAFVTEKRAKDGAAFFHRLNQEAAQKEYLFLYWEARLSRAAGEREAAARLFAEAEALAPDTDQRDACIWYLVDAAKDAGRDAFAASLKKYAPRRTKKAYFDDIFDETAAASAKKRCWSDFPALFPAVEAFGSAESAAHYAYVAGRVLELGLVNEKTWKNHAPLLTADEYFARALEKPQETFYYMRRASEKLGKKSPLAEELAATTRAHENEALLPGENAALFAFLDGFFEWGAADCALPYLREYLPTLTAEEWTSHFCARFLAEERTSGASENGTADCLRLVDAATRADGNAPPPRLLPFAFPPAPPDMEALVTKNAYKNGISPALLLALIRAESIFQSDVVSRSGAYGLTQLLPDTATDMLRRLRPRDKTLSLPVDLTESAALFDPSLNITLGAAYLAYLRDHLGSPTLATLAYNGGMGRIRRLRGAVKDLPDDLFLETIALEETRNYARKVLGGEYVYRLIND